VCSQTNPRSTSGLALVDFPDEQNLLHFKRCKSSQQFEVETAELTRVASLEIPVSGITTVRLMSSDPTERTLYTEFVPSTKSLFHHLWEQSTIRGGWRSCSPCPQVVGGRVGRWLKYYHTTTIALVEDYSAQLNWVLETATGKLNALLKSAPSLLPRTLDHSIRTYLDGAAKDADGWGAQWISTIHADLDLANLLVAPDGRLYIVDFADSRTGFVMEDFVRFWHSVKAIATVSRFRGRIIVRCAEELQRAYEVRSSDLDSPLVKLLRCWNSITFLLTSAQLRSRWGMGTRWMFDRLSRAHVGWLQSHMTAA
jgi:hypothetical protein